MKKDLIFIPAMLLIGVLLFMLRATGMIAHIAISVVGVLVLIAYTALTKKDWKIPALEIIMRAFYGIALITGIVILNITTSIPKFMMREHNGEICSRSDDINVRRDWNAAET